MCSSRKREKKKSIQKKAESLMPSEGLPSRIKLITNVIS